MRTLILLLAFSLILVAASSACGQTGEWVTLFKTRNSTFEYNTEGIETRPNGRIHFWAYILTGDIEITASVELDCPNKRLRSWSNGRPITEWMRSPIAMYGFFCLDPVTLEKRRFD